MNKLPHIFSKAICAILLAFAVPTVLGFSFEPAGRKPLPNFIDTTLNGKLRLARLFSLDKQLSNQLKVDEERTGSPEAYLANSSGKELLILHFHEGNIAGHFSEFELVPMPASLAQKAQRSSLKQFKSESGVFLGMGLNELLRIKGNDFKLQGEGKDSVLVYHFTQEEFPDFCKRYRMPGYFFKARIKQGKVQGFHFGFDYP
ncbi:MAG: hypothetical protein LCH37_07565 [Bacteroidetes bacterium]|nr:hypothetical protein [Bacteroidota bacterium]